MSIGGVGGVGAVGGGVGAVGGHPPPGTLPDHAGSRECHRGARPMNETLREAHGHQPVGIRLSDGTYDPYEKECGVCAEDWPCLVSRLAAALAALATPVPLDVERPFTPHEYVAAVRERDELRAAAEAIVFGPNRPRSSVQVRMILRAALHPETTETGS